MAEVFAGFVVGYALSLALAPIAAVALLRANRRSGFAQRFAPEGTNVVALSMVLHLLALLVFTAIGMVLGMALAGIDDRRPADGLGSPNVAYTAVVLALTAVLVIPLLVLERARPYAVVVALLFAALFGWGVPWLAQAA